MKKIGILNKKAVNVSGVLFISLLLLISIFAVGFSSSFAVESRPPKYIWGYVTFCNGGAVIGASVVVSAPGYDDLTDVTDSGGTYQIDVGPDGDGPDWPDGTAFTVTVTFGSWSGSNTGVLNGHTQCDVMIYPPALAATASASPTTVLVGETVSFTGSATGGTENYDWFWDFGDGQTSTQQNPSHIYTSDGTYTATLTVSDDCDNEDSDTVSITVNPELSCDAGGPYSGTMCDPVQFSGSASGGIPPYSFSWDFGDGNTGSGQNPSHQYDNDGTYTATLTVTDSQSPSDSVSDTATVTISTPMLTADAGGPYSGTMCDPVQFSGSASGGCSPYSFSWDFGDGNTGSGQNPSHQYDNDGTYTVTLTVTDGKGDTSEDTSSADISTTPVTADAGGPYSGNAGDPVQFSGSASGGCSPYSFSWDFGDGNTGSGQNPSHTYASEGVYTVTLTVTDDAGQMDTDTSTATINPASLDVNAGGPYYGAVGETVTFVGSVSGGQPPYTWSWNFGDGNSGSGQSAAHEYDAAGEYPVILTVTDSGGKSGSDNTIAYIEGEDPVANAGGPYAAVVDEDIQFEGNAFGGNPPYSWEWSFGDGFISYVQNPVHSYEETGEYTVTLTVTDDDGKTNIDTTTATISEDIPISDLRCTGVLSWPSVKSGEEVSDSFTVANVGDSGSVLNWEIVSYPDWGTWDFNPASGTNLKPEDGEVVVEVTVVAPTPLSLRNIFSLNNEETFEGDVLLRNSDDPSDSCSISVSMVVPRNYGNNPWVVLLNRLFERFPILQQLIHL